MNPWQLRIYNPEIEKLPKNLTDHWVQGWAEVQQEIGAGDKKPDLAELLKQTQVLALSHDGKIVASVCHRFVNLSDASVYRDSYFKHAWTPKDIGFLKFRGGPAVIGSQILVEKPYRRTLEKPRARELITYLCFGLLEEMQVDFLVGTMRVNRGMSELFQKAGATVLNPDRPYENVTVDLVYFELQKQPFRIPEDYQKLVKELLNQNDLRKQLLLVSNLGSDLDLQKRRAS